MASSAIFGVLMLVCAVSAANTLRMRRGSECLCTREMWPVCGVDGTTYDNLCELKCADVELDFEGPCENSRKKRSALCKCPKIRKPVCGQNRITYDNACLMKCDGVDLDFVGSCKQPRTKRGSEDTGKKVCACPRILLPMCGKDGVTYDNRCDMACNDAEFAYFGQC